MDQRLHKRISVISIMIMILASVVALGY